jgi:hypothetical protein
MRNVAFGILLLVCCGIAGNARTQAVADLKTVLERALNYVANYEEQLGAIIGEESYKQTAVWDGTRPGGLRVGTQRRRMLSDFLLTRVETEWYGVRNVRTVDGKPVSDKQTDFAKILTQSPDTVAAQLGEISKNNRRYNIGDFIRTFNVPTYPLKVLYRSNFRRFAFELKGKTSIGNVMVWEIRFTEVLHPTMIMDLSGDDQPQHGTLWIDPATGEVLKTETVIDARRGTVRGTVTFVVTYKENPKLNMLVIDEMREKYDSELHRVKCTATYSNFRRFETEVKLDIGPVQ